MRTLVEGVGGGRIRHRAHTLRPSRTRRHYATWPDEHLPALDGLSPREAAERPAMRQRLALLLDDMEHGEQSVPPEQRFDFDTLRAPLGLARDRPV